MLQAAHSIPTQKQATVREREKGIRLDLIKKRGRNPLMQGTMACSKEEREKGAWAEGIHFDFTFTSAMLSLACSSFITWRI